MDILSGLNDEQKKAASTTAGPVLILAGAGSGKTKTLTHRIAYLMRHEGIEPEQILAVTFTNKAAKEMRERLARLTGQPNSRYFMPWMGTFHGICVKILRRDGQAIGVSSNFVIYDEDDRQSLIKQAMKQVSVSSDELKPRALSSAISSAKNELVGTEEYASVAITPRQRNIAKVYSKYEELRRAAGALDFDDLLVETVRLLRESSDIREAYRNKFQHVLIDEYQDTNAAQYAIVKLLVNNNRNICVVGDDWQSIYSWRGADFKNILGFERDFPGALVIKLEQNYRSTGSILEAAHQVITKNVERTDKKLWTDAGQGAPVQIQPTMDEAEEAYTVASRISAQTAIGARQYDDFAVLYRMNAQSKALERAFMQHHIPYQLVGAVRFYDRKEIKDIIAYLRLIYQPSDRVSFARIANVPTRGVGAVSVEKFLVWQEKSGFDIITALVNVEQTSTLTARARTSLARLGDTLRSIQMMLNNGANPGDIISKLIDAIDYRSYLRDGTLQAEDREADIDALINDAQMFAALEDFLAEAALMSSADTETGDRKVTLMTLHAAKGLEFPAVFMVGVEEGVLPSARALMEGPRELEEERRLCYVGMTRAKEELHMLYANYRTLAGTSSPSAPSRFLEDMGYHAEGFVREASSRRNDFDEYVMEYDIGDTVRSMQFGVGEIVDIDGLAVTVRFESGITKKLNVEYARLGRA